MAKKSFLEGVIMLRVILSFDDGRKDNYRAAKEVLEQKKIPATFNITTGYIIGDLDDKDKPGPHEPMNVDELQELARLELFEIAGHGYRHDNDINNLINGVVGLREMLPGIEISGIASPHSQFDLNKLKIAKELFLKNGIKYLRISNDYSKMNKAKIWIRRINRLLHIPFLYYYVNKNALNNRNDFLLHSVPVIKDNSFLEVLSFVKKAVKDSKTEDKICILMFHSVLKKNEPFYDDLFSWDYDKFFKLCNSLKELENKQIIQIIKTDSI